MAPGEHTKVVFRAQEFIIHHLGGLDLASVERVGVSVTVAESGHVLAEHAHAPYDAERARSLIACQSHFVVFPPNIVFEVTAYSRAASRRRDALHRRPRVR
jgi:L-lactate utilization protein LutC